MKDLIVTLVQADLVWENRGENLSLFSGRLDRITEQTDLIILPEMFTTGFTLNAAEMAEPEKGSALQWMIGQAQKKKSDIMGSIIVSDDNCFYNRLYWVRKDGTYIFYDKRHLFRMADEHKVFSAGNRRVIGELNGWKILPLVCYDLRFPVWARGPKKDFDLIIYIANWPESRSSHWRLLLPARAVENQSYAVGVNRIGRDGTGKSYRGDSAIFDPLGNLIRQEAYNEIIFSETLSYDKLQRYREKFPVWMDSDTFNINDAADG